MQLICKFDVLSVCKNYEEFPSLLLELLPLASNKQLSKVTAAQTLAELIASNLFLRVLLVCLKITLIKNKNDLICW